MFSAPSPAGMRGVFIARATPGERPAWGIGMLTDDGRFVGVRQEAADVDELIPEFVDPDAEPGDESVVESDDVLVIPTGDDNRLLKRNRL